MIDEHHHYHRVQIATGNGRGACGCEQVRSVAVEGGGRVRRMDCAARALAQLLQGYRYRAGHAHACASQRIIQCTALR